MASCIRMEGQIMLLRPDLPEQACYRCAYGEAPDTLEDCPGAGIFAPVAGIAGSSAAHFALAYLAGMQPPTRFAPVSMPATGPGNLSKLDKLQGYLTGWTFMYRIETARI